MPAAFNGHGPVLAAFHALIGMQNRARGAIACADVTTSWRRLVRFAMSGQDGTWRQPQWWRPGRKL